MGRKGKSTKKSKQAAPPPPPQPKVVEHVMESDDEEIDEDEAFNSEDERMYGQFFEKGNRYDGKDHDDSEDEVTSDEDGDVSDDGDEDDDGGQYMLDLLGKLGSAGSKKTENESSVAAMAKIPESEFSSSISKKGLTLDNLMEGLQDTQGFRDLQKTFQKQTTATPAPLDKVVADRAQRKIAYAKQVKNISGWTDAVQENRKAETLDFKPKERVEMTRDTLVDNFEATTEFEKELEQALEEAGNQDEEAVLAAEEQALQDDLGANRLTMEEYKKRRGQLAKIRALMFYHEQKRHHMKKIKSKKYRRIRKKQKERLQESAMEAAAEEDEDFAKELKEKEEVSRIQERMTLAHKNTSKWAKRILKRGKNVDMETRKALSAQLKRGDDLRKKMMGDQEDESDNDSDEDLVESARKVLADTDQAPDLTDGKTGLFKLSFMQKGIEKQREKAKQEARKLLNELEANEMDDFDENNESNSEDEAPEKKVVATEKEMSKVMKEGELVATSLEFGNSNAIATSGAIEIDISTGDKDESDEKGNVAVIAGSTSEHVSTMVVANKSTPKKEGDVGAQEPAQRKRLIAKQAATEAEEEGESNPWMQSVGDSKEGSANTKKKKNKRGMVDVEGAADILDANSKVTERDLANKDPASLSEETGEPKKLSMLTQEELVRRAFAAPSEKEIEDEFQKEKDALAAEDDPTRKVDSKAAKEVSGWGSWAGMGALPPPPRKKKLPKKLQAPNKKEDPKRKRLDDKKPDVIINQKRLKKTANTFMLGEVPHPYSSRAEYEEAMLGGVGKEWNVTSAFKNMTRPEILTRAGKIIQPISKKVKVARAPAKF